MGVIGNGPLVNCLPEVTLYVRDGCHLCDVALETLEREGIHPTLVDIDRESAWRTEFDTCVPVVRIDGKIRFRGIVNRILLRRLLHARQRNA